MCKQIEVLLLHRSSEINNYQSKIEELLQDDEIEVQEAALQMVLNLFPYFDSEFRENTIIKAFLDFMEIEKLQP